MDGGITPANAYKVIKAAWKCSAHIYHLTLSKRQPAIVLRLRFRVAWRPPQASALRSEFASV